MNRNEQAENVSHTWNRVFARIHSLMPFASGLSLDVKVMLIRTLVFPHLKYCNVVINYMAVELSKHVPTCQNIWFLFHMQLSLSRSSLSIMKVNFHRNFHLILLLQSILKTMSPNTCLTVSCSCLIEVSETHFGEQLSVIYPFTPYSSFHNLSLSLLAIYIMRYPITLKPKKSRSFRGVFRELVRWGVWKQCCWVGVQHRS